MSKTVIICDHCDDGKATRGQICPRCYEDAFTAGRDEARTRQEMIWSRGLRGRIQEGDYLDAFIHHGGRCVTDAWQEGFDFEIREHLDRRAPSVEDMTPTLRDLDTLY